MALNEDCFNLKDLRDHLNTFSDEILEGTVAVLEVDGEECLVTGLGKCTDGSPSIILESI